MEISILIIVCSSEAFLRSHCFSLPLVRVTIHGSIEVRELGVSDAPIEGDVCFANCWWLARQAISLRMPHY